MQTCTEDYQCYPVSTNDNFVKCIDGACACVSNDYGYNWFTGNATAGNPCTCDYEVEWDSNGSPLCINCTAPRSIYYDDTGNPYCLNFQQAQTDLIDKPLIYENIIITLFQTYFTQENAIGVILGEIPLDDFVEDNCSVRVLQIGQYPNITGFKEIFLH